MSTTAVAPSRSSASDESAASSTSRPPRDPTSCETAATVAASFAGSERTPAVVDSAGTPHIPRTTWGHSLAARESTASTTSPGESASHTDSTAARDPRSTPPARCGHVATRAGATTRPPTTTATTTPSQVRPAAVARCTTHASPVTTSATTRGSAISSRRSAHGWSGVMPGRASVSSVDPDATSSAGSQASTRRDPADSTARRTSTASTTSATTSATGPTYQDSHATVCSA